jgi:hypothetical protein
LFSAIYREVFARSAKNDESAWQLESTSVGAVLNQPCFDDFAGRMSSRDRWEEPMQGSTIMRFRIPMPASISIPALAITALLGLAVHANAQMACPELTRLRSEAQEALKQSMRVAASERCYAYNRLSQAWGAVAQYVNDNSESCRISGASLKEFERYRSEAVRDRDRVCAGRLLRPYRADIIQR